MSWSFVNFIFMFLVNDYIDYYYIKQIMYLKDIVELTSKYRYWYPLWSVDVFEYVWTNQN